MTPAKKSSKLLLAFKKINSFKPIPKKGKSTDEKDRHNLSSKHLRLSKVSNPLSQCLLFEVLCQAQISKSPQIPYENGNAQLVLHHREKTTICKIYNISVVLHFPSLSYLQPYFCTVNAFFNNKSKENRTKRKRKKPPKRKRKQRKSKERKEKSHHILLLLLLPNPWQSFGQSHVAIVCFNVRDTTVANSKTVPKLVSHSFFGTNTDPDLRIYRVITLYSEIQTNIVQ